jgi:hypothetical protein
VPYGSVPNITLYTDYYAAAGHWSQSVYIGLGGFWQDGASDFFGAIFMLAFSSSRCLRRSCFAFGLFALGAAAQATGLATCESGDKSTWQAKEKLEQSLKDRGWTVRRIKEDGGCYEVYALDEKGQRGEYYFHPVTLEAVPIKQRH